MNKLVEILNKLSEDCECNVVVMTTNSPNYCQGIDYTDVIEETTEKRKNVSVQLTNATK